MQELIRLQNIKKRAGIGYELQDYHVNIYKGEVLYIQGVSGSGKALLEQILTGEERPQEGVIYFEGSRLDPGKIRSVLQEYVGAMGMQNPLAEKMSILDNVEIIRKVDYPFRAWNRKQARRNTEKMLNDLGIDAEPETKAGVLSFLDRQKLCIAKLVAGGTKLIIINCVHSLYGEEDIRILREFIRQYCSQGISFLVLADRPNGFISVADRFQILHRGTDLMEWRAGERDNSILEHYVTADQPQKAESSVQRGKIMGILDTGREGFKNRFTTEGAVFDGKTVWIPQNSGECLLDHMTLEDNLSICIPKRAGRWGTVNERARQILKQDFLERIGRKEEVQFVWQLSASERKVLSVYRWELARPEKMMLENPFWGMDRKEMAFFSGYLKTVKRSPITVTAIIPFLEKEMDCFDEVLPLSSVMWEEIKNTTK